MSYGIILPMDESTLGPAGKLKKTSRLSAPERRQLKASLFDASAEGQDISTALVRKLAEDLFSLQITLEAAQKLLIDFGYEMTNDLLPSLSSSGSLATIHVWTMRRAARPLSPAEKSAALAERMRVLTDALVEDIMEDELLKFALLPEIAREASRSFALSLSAAVRARARISASNILPTCGDIAHLTFKSGIQTP